MQVLVYNHVRPKCFTFIVLQSHDNTFKVFVVSGQGGPSSPHSGVAQCSGVLDADESAEKNWHPEKAKTSSLIVMPCILDKLR